MDGRAALTLGISLLIGMAGCQHQAFTVPNSSPNALGSTPPPVPAPNQVKKDSKPKDLPPSVLVSYGDWKSLEAFALGMDPSRQQVLSDEARENYEKALQKDPKCVAAYHGLARLHSGLHNYPLAVETYQRVLRLAPKNAALWYDLGVCHNYQKNWAPALDCLSRATQLEPSNRNYANTQGIVLAAAGRYEDSLNCFIRSNGEALGYFRLSQTLQHLQQTDLSRRYLEVAVQKDPSLAPQMTKLNQEDVAANDMPPAVQQTAYQAPSAAPAQDPAVSLPQVISRSIPAAAQQPMRQPVVLPSPPSIGADAGLPNP
jgi:Tfp pilus assembly protein PilF